MVVPITIQDQMTVGIFTQLVLNLRGEVRHGVSVVLDRLLLLNEFKESRLPTGRVNADFFKVSRWH